MYRSCFEMKLLKRARPKSEQTRPNNFGLCSGHVAAAYDEEICIKGSNGVWKVVMDYGKV